MVHESFWFVHLHLRDEQGTKLLHPLLFVCYYTVRSVTWMKYVVRQQVVSGGVSSQLVKLRVFPGYAFFTVLEYMPLGMSIFLTK